MGQSSCNHVYGRKTRLAILLMRLARGAFEDRDFNMMLGSMCGVAVGCTKGIAMARCKVGKWECTLLMHTKVQQIVSTSPLYSEIILSRSLHLVQNCSCELVCAALSSHIASANLAAKLLASTSSIMGSEKSHPSLITSYTALEMRLACSSRPRCLRSIDPERIIAVGLAWSLPLISRPT